MLHRRCCAITLQDCLRSPSFLLAEFMRKEFNIKTSSKFATRLIRYPIRKTSQITVFWSESDKHIQKGQKCFEMFTKEIG